jgi:DNA repair exonuclease SbcCD ATPase subunit
MMMMTPAPSESPSLNDAIDAPLHALELAEAHQVIQNLEQQDTLYGQVLQILIQKRISILQHDIDELPKQDDALRQLRKQCLRLEREREGLQKSLWPQALAPVQAAMIRMALPPEERETFDDVRERLKRTLRQVQQIQQHIEELLNDSLQWVNQSIGLLTQGIGPEKSTVYTPQGITRQPLPSNTLEANI